MIYNFPMKKRKQITNYLTFSSPNPFSISVATPGWNGKLYYSTDTKTWAEWTGNEVNATEADGTYALYFIGVGNAKITGDFSNNWTLSGSSISCTGNIESLLDYEIVAAGQHPTMADYCYFAMFNDCTSLTTAPSLPATKLADYCYGSMFGRCTSLTTAPSLPATKLADYCYDSMFNNCTSLTTAPSLPATKLADYCYYSMFYRCTSLTTVPSLPATTLARFCYYSMFERCNKIKLAISQNSEYDNEYRIPKLGNGVKAPQALSSMFAKTGGTFTGTPSINTTYYTSNTIV